MGPRIARIYFFIHSFSHSFIFLESIVKGEVLIYIFFLTHPPIPLKQNEQKLGMCSWAKQSMIIQICAEIIADIRLFVYLFIFFPRGFSIYP